MQITYEKFDDYYLFSHKPDTRVYLGNNNPEDYILDELEQMKRTKSCGYFDKNGLMVEEPEEYDDEFYDNHEYECTYSFIRKIGGMQHLGGPDKSCEFVSSESDKAWAWYIGKTPEQYQEHKAEIEKKFDARKREKPSLHNLVMANGETYYVNDAGDRISFEEHVALMKEQLGEDCFDKERENLDPKYKKFAENYISIISETENMPVEEKLKYIEDNKHRLSI